MNIRFGSWMLAPADGLNWQLWHRHKTKNGKDAGAVKWHATGRYYQDASLDRAVIHAAECDARERQTPASATLAEFVAEYRALLEEYTQRLEAAAREIKAAQG